MATGGSSSFPSSFNPSYQSSFGNSFGERTSYQPPSSFVSGSRGFPSPFTPRSSGGGAVSGLAMNFSSLSGRVSYSGPTTPPFSMASMNFSTRLPSSSRLESQSAFPSSSLSRAHHPISRMSSLDTPPVSGLSMGSFFALPPTGISDRSFPFSQHPLGSSTLAGRMHYPPLFTSPSFEHKGALIPTGSGFTSSLPGSRSFQRDSFPTPSDFSLKMDDSLYRSLATPFNPTRPLYTLQERVLSAFESTMLRRTQQIAFFDPVSCSSLIVNPHVFGAFVRAVSQKDRAALEDRTGANWKAITGVTARGCKNLASGLAHDLYTTVYVPIAATAALFNPNPSEIWSAEKMRQGQEAIDLFFGTKIAEIRRWQEEAGFSLLELPMPVAGMRSTALKISESFGKSFSVFHTSELAEYLSRLGNNSQKISKVVQTIESFLGGKGKIIVNSDGDLIIMRGNRKIRFDVNDPHGYEPHFHIETLDAKGRAIDAGSKHHYYFEEK